MKLTRHSNAFRKCVGVSFTNQYKYGFLRTRKALTHIIQHGVSILLALSRWYMLQHCVPQGRMQSQESESCCWNMTRRKMNTSQTKTDGTKMTFMQTFQSILRNVSSHQNISITKQMKQTWNLSQIPAHLQSVSGYWGPIFAFYCLFVFYCQHWNSSI